MRDEGEVVSDRRDAKIVPIPKRGDFKHCDNWRGISLLEVVGKDPVGTAASGVRKGHARVTVWVQEGERMH